MKLLISLLLSLTFLSTTTFAGTSGNGFKAAVDDLNYALEVEWDQRDMKFYQAAMKDFQLKIEGMNLSGDPKETLMEGLTSLPDSNYKRDVLQAISTLESISWSQVQNILKETSSKAKAQGSNWSGRNSAAPALVIGVVVIMMVIILSRHEDHHRDNRYTIPPYTVEPVIEDPDFGCDVYPLCDKYRT